VAAVPPIPADAASDLLAGLVAIDSVNPGLVPGAAGEAAIVTFLRNRLEAAGFATLVVTPDEHPDRPSLLAWYRGSRPAPTLLLNGHVDTVGVEGMPAPFEPKVEGDRLYGRGAADMKGGVAGLVLAAEEIAREDCGSVVLALVADEENASLGMEAVIACLPETGLRPDVAVVGEPTHLDRTVSLRGYAVVDVEFAGWPAHSSLPAEGVNAVTHLGRLLGAVEEADAALHGRGVWLSTVVSGGSAPFMVPARARATIERRTVPGETVEDAVSEVEQMLQRLRDDDPTVAATARLMIGRAAWQLEESGPAHDFAGLLEAALRGAPGRREEPFAAPYWMEAPLLLAAGIPAVVCGPSGGGMHAVDEWVDLRQVRAYPRALMTAFRAFAAAGYAD
jgi:acetylornithine deacetylase